MVPDGSFVESRFLASQFRGDFQLNAEASLLKRRGQFLDQLTPKNLVARFDVGKFQIRKDV